MTTQQAAQRSAPDIALTPSVENVAASLAGAVTSWQVVEKLLELHGEYGRNRGRDLRQRQAPTTGARQPVRQWLDLVRALFDPVLVPSLHGRLVILGLCRLETEADLAEYLRATGFLAALQDELREDFASLLTPEAAGEKEAYRGEFIRILQNRGKVQPAAKVKRTAGFLIVAKRGRRLNELASLTQRQTYNRCFTARYVLPSGGSLADGLRSFVYDMASLQSDAGTIEGDLLPDPLADRTTWKPLLQSPVAEALTSLTRQRRSQASQVGDEAPRLAANLDSLLRAFGEEEVLSVGLRLVLLFEFRGVRPDAALGDLGLKSDVMTVLGRLPERTGIVFSGLPPEISGTLEQHLSGVFSLLLPLEPELTRGLPPGNDVPTGPDLLGIGSEVRALAEAIALKDLTPPLVVGVMGGWGAGKSFVLHLLEERLQEIRCERVPDPEANGAAEEFPFVGHPYVIRFDAWTFAKSNLWASLMQTIFLQLERQIGLERILEREVGISLRDETEIWRVLSRLDDDERNRLTRTETGQKVLAALRQFGEGRLTEGSLWTTLADFRKEERNQLARSEREAAALGRERDAARRQLEDAVDEQIAERARGLAWRALAGRARDRFEQRLWQRVKEEADKRGQAVPDAEALGAAVAWYRTLWQGRGPLLYAFLAFTGVALATLLPGFPDLVSGLGSVAASAAGALGAALSAGLKGYQWLEARRREYVQLIDERRRKEKRPREELINEALALAATGAGGAAGPAPETIARHPEVARAAADVRNVEERLATKQAEVEGQRQRAGITARHPSLLDFVQQRLEGKYYENKLGLLHQVQSDLAELSTALLPTRARKGAIEEEHATRLKKLFPRGDPRIILIIDDLDRCPPTRVVQVLEAAQLLVKTPLFVVVLAIDVRYVTRALEKRYDRVLVRGGEPSGLDYIEKIIQIPYRVRNVSPPAVGGFLSSQMQLEERVRQPASGVAPADEADPTDGGDTEITPESANLREGERSGVTPSRPVRSELHVLPTEVLRFNEHDHRVISLCCSAVDVNPRAMKRLVNVYKLLKIIWFRRGRPDGPGQNVKRAMLMLLVLAARYPEVIRQLLRHMEDIYRLGDQTVDEAMAPLLAAYCQRAEVNAVYPPDWSRVRRALLNEKMFPTGLTFRHLEETNFQLVSAFCFVSETDPEREASVLWGTGFHREGEAEASRPAPTPSLRQRPAKQKGEATA